MTTALLCALVCAVVPRSECGFEWAPRQQYDASCGYAVVTGVIARFAGARVTESTLIDEHSGLEATGDPGAASELTLGDLRDILIRYDIASRGYRMTDKQLAQAIANRAPVVVHFSHPEGHFALLLGTIDSGPTVSGWVIADPAVGTRALDPREFRDRWSGVVLVVSGDPTRDAACTTQAHLAARSVESRVSVVAGATEEVTRLRAGSPLW